MSDLLPYNATPQERAISECLARADAVPQPVRDVWDADTCPPALLPWLAWAYSVDQWDSAWSVEQQREFIKRSVEVHRYKGTIGAVREALGGLFINARIQEWFAQTPAGDPYTFRVLLEAEQVGISQSSVAALFDVIERTKNLRSQLSDVELTVFSPAGPKVAAATGMGSDIELSNYNWPTLACNETTIICA